MTREKLKNKNRKNICQIVGRGVACAQLWYLWEGGLATVAAGGQQPVAGSHLNIISVICIRYHLRLENLTFFCCRTCPIHLFVKLLVIPHWWNYRGLDCGDIFSQYVSIPFTNEHEIRCYLLVPQFIFRLFIHRICFKTSYFCNHFLTFKIETISKWSNFITEFLLLAVLEQFLALDWTHDTGSACLAWCTRYCKNLIVTLHLLICVCVFI